ncbi:hypothetical protein T492DRAFT_203810 [Pavlovales sp. CCMP2436]|nr:hypothetical protein T492DRAFT_203810 [Pavlovales sp. CCMP2436]
MTPASTAPEWEHAMPPTGTRMGYRLTTRRGRGRTSWRTFATGACATWRLPCSTRRRRRPTCSFMWCSNARRRALFSLVRPLRARFARGSLWRFLGARMCSRLLVTRRRVSGASATTRILTTMICTPRYTWTTRVRTGTRWATVPWITEASARRSFCFRSSSAWWLGRRPRRPPKQRCATPQPMQLRRSACTSFTGMGRPTSTRFGATTKPMPHYGRGHEFTECKGLQI